MESDVQWPHRFLRLHHRRHPREMGREEVNACLTHLVEEGNGSASSQNQALGALLCLYRELLERDLDLEGVVRARQKRRLPVVLTPAEVRAVLERIDGVEAPVSDVLQGSGLRLLEALRLREQLRKVNGHTRATWPRGTDGCTDPERSAAQAVIPAGTGAGRG